MDDIIDLLPKIRGSYRANVNLAKVNWFGIGGEAQILFKPEDLDDLAFFLQNKPKNIDVNIIGVGSNLLVRDEGVKGVVIKLGRSFTSHKIIGDTIWVGAACLDYNLAMIAKEHSIGGFEFFSGIPGTIGGALAMNAGAYGSDTSSILISADLLDDRGNIHHMSKEEIGFSYRSNNLAKGWIFTAALFQGFPSSRDLIEAKISEISHNRETTQPIKTKTTGSFFANPPGMKAWQLIDQAGCRGMAEGDAISSEKHCNFIINRGNAKAKDIENLARKIQQKVLDSSGITLKWEVKTIGK